MNDKKAFVPKIGDLVYIKDNKSFMKGRSGVVLMRLDKNDFIVKVLENGVSHNVVVKAEGLQENSIMERGDNIGKGATCEVFDSKGERAIDDKSVQKVTDCVASLKQTKASNINTDGQYTPKRVALHKEIISKFKKGVTCINKGKPIAVLMGGSPASGKSTFLKKYRPYLLSNNIFKIDADEVRAQLHEYKGWNASQTQDETSDIVKTLISDKNIGIPCLFDFIYDGTMTSPTRYIKLVEVLKSQGYQIFIVFMTGISKDVIKTRILNRYKESGRFVPMIVVDDFYANGENTMKSLKGMVDGYLVIDGSDYDYKILEQGGKKLPNKRLYEKLGETIKMSKGGGVGEYESNLVYFTIDEDGADTLLFENFRKYVDYEHLKNGDVLYKMDRKRFERFWDLADSTSEKFSDSIEEFNKDGSDIEQMKTGGELNQSTSQDKEDAMTLATGLGKGFTSKEFGEYIEDYFKNPTEYEIDVDSEYYDAIEAAWGQIADEARIPVWQKVTVEASPIFKEYSKMKNGGGVGNDESNLVYFTIDEDGADTLLFENFRKYVDYEHLKNGDVLYKMDRKRFERFWDLADSTSEKFSDSIEEFNKDGSDIEQMKTGGELNQSTSQDKEDAMTLATGLGKGFTSKEFGEYIEDYFKNPTEYEIDVDSEYYDAIEAAWGQIADEARIPVWQKVTVEASPIFKEYSKMKNGGGVGNEVYIEFLNKEKGFEKDVKHFNSYNEAVEWAKKNFDKFSPDMIKRKMLKGGDIKAIFSKEGLEASNPFAFKKKLEFAKKHPELLILANGGGVGTSALQTQSDKIVKKFAGLKDELEMFNKLYVLSYIKDPGYGYDNVFMFLFKFAEKSKYDVGFGLFIYDIGKKSFIEEPSSIEDYRLTVEKVNEKLPGLKILSFIKNMKTGGSVGSFKIGEFYVGKNKNIKYKFLKEAKPFGYQFEIYKWDSLNYTYKKDSTPYILDKNELKKYGVTAQKTQVDKKTEIKFNGGKVGWKHKIK